MRNQSMMKRWQDNKSRVFYNQKVTYLKFRVEFIKFTCNLTSHNKSLLSMNLQFRLFFLTLLMGWCVCSCSTITQVPALTEEEIEQEAEVQFELTKDRFIAGTQRIADASWPLITRNLELCEGYTDFQIGVWMARKIIEDNAIDAMVWGVAKDSPAALAGLQPRDMIVEVDENVVKNSTTARSQLNRALRQFSQEGRTDPIELFVIRWESESSFTPLSFSIQPVETCRSEIYLSGSLTFNAYASGRRIGVYTGLLNFLEKETDLQYILAHELAHNVYGHVRKARARSIFGGLLDGVLLTVGIWTDGLFTRLGLRTSSKRFENEADYISMYLLANAGVDLDGVEDVWRRVSAQVGLKESGTHPSRPVRYLRMAKARQEIIDKIERGEPLTPELKRKR